MCFSIDILKFNEYTGGNMRADFATIGSGLTYEIRNIVEIANFMKSKGLEISWENIGDPVMKGEQVPEWIKDVLKEVIDDNMSFAYSPTKGVDSTRDKSLKKILYSLMV